MTSDVVGQGGGEDLADVLGVIGSGSGVQVFQDLGAEREVGVAFGAVSGWFLSSSPWYSR